MLSAPGGARFLRVQVPNPHGSRKELVEGKGVHREVESEGIPLHLNIDRH